MLSPEMRKAAAQRAKDSESESNHSTSSYSALPPVPPLDLASASQKGPPSPQREIMFSGLSAGVIEVDKLYVYNHAEFDKSNWHQRFEYVMVFPMMGPDQTPWKSHRPDNEPSHRARDIVNRMIEVGMELYPYLSLQGDELIVLITCPESTLANFTDDINFIVELDPAYCRDKMSKGDKDHRQKPVKITDDPQYSRLHPFEHIFGKYDTHLDQKIFKPKGDGGSPFDRPTRLKIMYYMLTVPRCEGGCGIKLHSLLLKNEILAFFPPHNKHETEVILDASSGALTMPWRQPVELIKAYMGEKVALYYVFMAHYSLWLILPAVIGLIFQLVVWGTGPDFSHPVLPFYGVCISLWAITMLEFWKRTQRTQAMKWGMLDFEDEEPDRPEFKGDRIKSFIDGRDMTYFPPKQHGRLVAASQSVIVTFIFIVIGVVAGIYYMRYVLQKQSLGPYASTIASVVNTIQITIFNVLYQLVAVKLTNAENHRTDTNYQDALIVKMFVFQFVNSYASFFYIAFIAANLDPVPGQPEGFMGQCGYYNCMQPLSVNLAIIFGSRLTVTNLIEVLMPIYSCWQKRKAETEGKDVALLTPPELDFILMEPDILLDSIQNFADTAVQYGFTVLFITALPIATFFSLVSNYVKLKVQTWKLITFYQRPVPQGAQDIGTWQDIFNIISVVAVVTNAAIICFTMDVLYKDSQVSNARIVQIGGIPIRANFTLVGRLWVFFGFIATLVAVQFVISLLIPDEPIEVTTQHDRQKFIVKKLIERQPDEDFDSSLYASDQAEEAEGATPDASSLGAGAGCCSCLGGGSAGRGGAAKPKKAKLDVSDIPLVPIFEYPDTLSDIKDNYKKHHD